MVSMEETRELLAKQFARDLGRNTIRKKELFCIAKMEKVSSM